MTPSPDLISELRASRPAAPAALRARVRELAVQAEPGRPFWTRFRLPAGRIAAIAVPATVALAVLSAGVLGLARSDSPTSEATRQGSGLTEKSVPEAAPGTDLGVTTLDSTAPATDRAQRISATLSVEVRDPEDVSRAAQEALQLTERLGGHVVSSSVATGDEGSASLTVRVPADRVQEAIVQLSQLGRLASQQVTIDDLQEGLDTLEQRAASLRNQIARITARLEAESLDATTRATLEARRQALRNELRGVQSGITATRAEARMATIQLSVVTPEALGSVTVPSRLDRTLDEALNVLVWEGVVALAIAIVAAPFALLAALGWAGRRLYRRREDERLLAA